MADFPRPRRHLRGVAVLLYHGVGTTGDSVSDPGERRYRVDPTVLRGHLQMIAEGRHRGALLSELWRSPTAGGDSPPQVVLTFDDGRATDYAVAYPVLLEAGQRAEFFVNTAVIGTRGFLSWADVAEMQGAGMSFQSHSHDHIALVGLPRPVLKRQLQESKSRLQDGLGRAVEFLAVPYGLVDRTVVEVAREEGYRGVCISRDWPARPGAPTVNRVAVYAKTSSHEFHKLLNRDAVTYARRRGRTMLLALPKRVAVRWWPGRLGVRVLRNSA